MPPSEVTCRSCGKRFLVKPSRATTARYCSPECRVTGTRKLQTKHCLVCGQAIRLAPAALSRGEGKYCSRACSSAARIKSSRTVVFCPQCGTEFSKKKCEKKRFCSVRCYHASRRTEHDITGRAFGRLLVLAHAYTAHGRVYWQCVCDCGNSCVVRQDALVFGKTTSCGKHFASELTGQRFGRLKVLRRAANNSCGQTRWICFCDCGKTLTVLGNSLTSGNTRSCGCYKTESLRSDLRGNRIGRLTVLEVADRPSHVCNGSAYWLCACDCGNTVVVSADSLKKGLKGTGKGARSCGCLNRESASQRMSREGNPNWRAEWSDEERRRNTAPRRTKRYIAWCRSVYTRDGFTCVLCGKRGGVLHAHHLEGWDTNRDLRFIDICISNAIYWGILEGGCPYETIRISSDIGTAAA